jgi:thiaminase/transcriptional activator TenA
MRFSERLKKNGTPILRAQLDHPFVKGLADGTLPLDRFRYYMIQDALYIADYARAMAWVAPLMPDVQDVLAMLEAARQTFETEEMLKEHYFKQFGITMEDALRSTPAPTCKAYVDHLFRYTRNGTVAEGMAAILPCGWAYLEIGFGLTGKREIPDDHPYKEWLMTYAVPEFRDLVNGWFDILDRAVSNYPEKDLTHLEGIFLTSCRHELKFWDMGWNKR